MLQSEHPQVAYRDCDDCRKWLYDEDASKPERKLDRQGNPIRRTQHHACLCERPSGCPKGHWSKPKEMTKQQRQLLDFHASVRASYGAALTGEAAQCRALLYVLGQLDLIQQSIDRGKSYGAMMSVMAAIGSAKGPADVS